jgi:hypothetical protein
LQGLEKKLEAEKAQPDLPEAERTKEPTCPDYYAAASHLMEDMQQQRNITSENLDLIFRYLETAPNYPAGASGVHAVEVEFLLMVRNFLGLLSQDYDLDPGSDAMITLRNTLVKAIACRNQMEVLYTVPDERMFAWLQSELKRADETRRNAEDLLLGYRLNEANAEYDKLLGANGQLASIRQKEATLADAYKAHDAAGQSLPFTNLAV